MSEPFLAEVRILGCNFAPRGWAFCDGQFLQISQNTALFSLIGTIYGGDGRTTMALPNLMGRIPMHPGHGSGLTERRLGQNVGVEIVSLTESQIPNHNHTLMGSNSTATAETSHEAAGLYPAVYYGKQGPKQRPQAAYDTAGAQKTVMSDSSLSETGGSQPHENCQPFLVLNFCIALRGLYPSRS